MLQRKKIAAAGRFAFAYDALLPNLVVAFRPAD